MASIGTDAGWTKCCDEGAQLPKSKKESDDLNLELGHQISRLPAGGLLVYGWEDLLPNWFIVRKNRFQIYANRKSVAFNWNLLAALAS